MSARARELSGSLEDPKTNETKFTYKKRREKRVIGEVFVLAALAQGTHTQTDTGRQPQTHGTV